MNPCTELRSRIDPTLPAPLYRQLAEELGRWIESGKLKRGERLLSERDLANQLGVSRRTVRAALAELISRKHLVPAHGRGHFVHRRLPRRPVRVVVPEMFLPEHREQHPQHYDWIQAAEIATQCKIHYVYTPTVEQMVAAMMDRNGGFDAALIFRPSRPWLNEILRNRDLLLGKTALPFLVANRDLSGTGIPFVTTDYERMSEAGTEHLLQLGHRRVGIFLSDADTTAMDLMIRGYKSALSRRGGDISNDQIFVLHDLSAASMEKALTETLQQANLTGLVIGGSMLTLPAERVVARLGIDVPGRVSLVALTEPHAIAQPGLNWTCWVQRNQDTTTQAVRSLCELANCEAARLIETRIPPTFRAGQTTSAPPPVRIYAPVSTA